MDPFKLTVPRRQETPSFCRLYSFCFIKQALISGLVNHRCSGAW